MGGRRRRRRTRLTRAAVDEQDPPLTDSYRTLRAGFILGGGPEDLLSERRRRHLPMNRADILAENGSGAVGGAERRKCGTDGHGQAGAPTRPG